MSVRTSLWGSWRWGFIGDGGNHRNIGKGWSRAGQIYWYGGADGNVLPGKAAMIRVEILDRENGGQDNFMGELKVRFDRKRKRWQKYRARRMAARTSLWGSSRWTPDACETRYSNMYVPGASCTMQSAFVRRNYHLLTVPVGLVQPRDYVLFQSRGDSSPTGINSSFYCTGNDLSNPTCSSFQRKTWGVFKASGRYSCSYSVLLTPTRLALFSSRDSKEEFFLTVKLSSNCRQAIVNLSSTSRQTVVKLSLHCRPTAVKLSWNCHKTVVKLLWNCCQTLVKPSSNCRQTVVKLPSKRCQPVVKLSFRSQFVTLSGQGLPLETIDTDFNDRQKTKQLPSTCASRTRQFFLDL